MSTRKIVVVLSGLLLAGGAVHAQQPAQEKTAPAGMKFDIASQPVSDALNQFARLTGLQVVIDWKQGEGVVSSRLTGDYTPQAALKVMLAGTGLEYEFLSERVVAVRVGKGKIKGSSAVGPADQMRVAALDTEAGSEDAAGDSGSSKDSQQITVEGQRDKAKAFTSRSIDLSRSEDDVLPYTVFTAREIEASGAPDIDQFLRSRLSSNFSSSITEEVGGNLDNLSSVQNTVNFRGLNGIGNGHETVILLNGRRLPPQRITIAGEMSTPVPGNYRGIPISMIERIEVLPSSGSTIYGEGATGGVINIITRKHLEGGQASIRFEDPADGYAPTRSADVSYSLPMAGGLDITLSAGMRERRSLKVEDRADVTAWRWRKRTWERNPSAFNTASMLTLISSTTNIRSPASSPLFGPGTSRFTSVPTGYTGGEGITPFLDRQGVLNLDLAESAISPGGFARKAALGPSSDTKNLNIVVAKSLNDNWEASIEANRMVETQTGSQGGILLSHSIPATYPNNPFGVNVSVVFDDTRLQGPENKREYSIEDTQFIASLRGDIGKMRLLIDGVMSKNKNNSKSRGFNSPLGGWDNAFRSGIYNPFVDTRAIAPAPASFYEEFVLSKVDMSSAAKSMQLSTKLSGPILKLPAGYITATSGLEWLREDRYHTSHTSVLVNSRTGAFLGESQGSLANSSQLFVAETFSVYSEINIPVLGEKLRLPAAERLELFIAGRISDQVREGFNSAGEEVSYDTSPYLHSVGLRYDPIPGVGIRLSQSMGFTPPILPYVTPDSPSDYVWTVEDRLRDDELVSLQPSQYVTGGNPNLDPETSRSRNVGVIFTPTFTEGLRVSVDYLESVRDDAITVGLLPQTIVDLESELPGRVARGPAAGDPSGVGPILYVDARHANFARISLKSVDMSIQKRLDGVLGGSLLMSVSATKNISLKIQTSATSEPEEAVRNPRQLGARSIEWNANGQISLEKNNWVLGWSTRYFDDVLIRPTSYAVMGGDRAKWALEHDVVFSYRTPDSHVSWLSNVSVGLGVKNVFDREPRFFANGNGDIQTLGVAPFDSVVGRSLWLQIRKDL